MVDMQQLLNCPKCPKETENPVYYSVVHDLGMPSTLASAEPSHAAKVIEGKVSK